jgi:TM2 domain-containing membrane protein YozV
MKTVSKLKRNIAIAILSLFGLCSLGFFIIYFIVKPIQALITTGIVGVICLLIWSVSVLAVYMADREDKTIK